MNKLIYLLVLLILVSGCATMSQATATNRSNLIKLSIGMTKGDVLSIMGTKPKTAYYSKIAPNYIGYIQEPIAINNPYRSEILQGKDKIFEVIYYATDVKSDDAAITDDELTPLVFDNGKLIGWGWSFLQDNIQKYEIRIR